MVEELYRSVGLPENHWGCLIAELPESDYKAEFVRWIDDVKNNILNGNGLLLYGKHGFGKSGLAAIAIKAALKKKIGCLWVPAEALPKYKINEEDFMYSEFVTMHERIMRVPLLVIDDLLLNGQKSGWVETHLELVVRRRVDNKLCTIITTNHSVDSIVKDHKALSSILSEATKPLLVEGKNFRALNRR